MPKKVTTYTLNDCPYCKRAKELLARKGIPFEDIDVTNDPQTRDAIEAKTGWDTLPIILIGDELIGGSEELLELDASGKLEAKLSEKVVTPKPVNPTAVKQVKWYYRIPSIVTALILLGPFGFPLLWKSPQCNLAWKIILTVIFTAATVYMVIGTWHIYVALIDTFKQAGLM